MKMSYELLIEGNEPIDDWTVCLICLEVDRTSAVARRRWRCSDCGTDNSVELQKPLRTYLVENPLSLLERNLTEWGAVKGVRPAYKMLKSARYKCLMTLRKRSEP